ncbi:putative ATP/GTP-binding protein [Catenulispora acidiphila DSM 44928]|uniref:Putative ATP/GTP-binding protein n=1 Tax=Catenulispora acidiphila (strain DSM 44928 / JCM 14897 / NBRC 102108 / NRRL B-24433 / ID139908) TaxID=479433 RepID=C7PYU8_CATAD|nr:putative ATP/GTP-binding protein [Catenulispora acidiphila DSM 44928]
MSGAALIVATVVAGLRFEDGSQDSSWGGVSEAGRTVYVSARQAETSPQKGNSRGGAPIHDCALVPDPSHGGQPSGNSGGAAGSWYQWRCQDSSDQQNLTAIPKNDLETWVPTPTMSPGDVAQAAAKEIHLPAPAMNTSPRDGVPQWVNFPMFLWTDSLDWHPLSATANVPGLQASATATPEKLTWDMGDGSVVTCTGPGTPFTDSTPATSVSPDCGYVYRRASDAESSGEFTVRVTESWRVTWTGGGQSGTLPDLAATSSIAVRVAESQALVTSVH